MRVLRGLEKVHLSLLNVALSISGVAMILMAFVSTADVVAYLVVGKPFPGANETVEAALAVCVAMTIANAQYRRDHVVVDILTDRFSERGRRLSDFFGVVVGLFCMVLVSIYAWDLAVESVERREAAFTLYSFPIYPWKVLYATGFTIAAFELARQAIRMMLGDASGGSTDRTQDAFEADIQ